MSAKLMRRLWNSIGFGSVSAVNDTGTVQTAQVKLGYSMIRDGVPVVQLFGLSGSCPIGSDATVLFLGGDPSNGVVVATNHQGTRPIGQGAGETTVYNAHQMAIILAAAGIVAKCGGKPMTINGDLQVTGKVIAGYGGSDSVTLQQHTHSGVETGAGDTSAPVAGT